MGTLGQRVQTVLKPVLHQLLQLTGAMTGEHTANESPNSTQNGVTTEEHYKCKCRTIKIQW